MTGKTHQLIGITAGLSSYLLMAETSYGPATFGTVLVGSHLLSLLPDLDQSAADFWDSVPFGHTIGRVADPFIKHRNISHSLLGLVIVGFGLKDLLSHFPAYWGINVSVVFVVCLIAYSSHLVADMLTVEGIPLLFPYPKMIGIPPKPLEGIRIETGKWFENLVIFPIVNIILIVLLWTHWSLLKIILFR